MISPKDTPLTDTMSGASEPEAEALPKANATHLRSGLPYGDACLFLKNNQESSPVQNYLTQGISGRVDVGFWPHLK